MYQKYRLVQKCNGHNNTVQYSTTTNNIVPYCIGNVLCITYYCTAIKYNSLENIVVQYIKIHIIKILL